MVFELDLLSCLAELRRVFDGFRDGNTMIKLRIFLIVSQHFF